MCMLSHSAQEEQITFKHCMPRPVLCSLFTRTCMRVLKKMGQALLQQPLCHTECMATEWGENEESWACAALQGNGEQVVPPSLLGRKHVSPSNWDPMLIH